MRLLTFTFVLLLARSLSASPILTMDYETGELTSGIPGIGATMPLAVDAMTINSNIVRSGSYSFRAKVQFNTNYISAGSWRAEEDTIGILPTHYNWGDRVDYQFSLRLDSSWQSDNRNSDYIVHQWKRYGTGPDMFVDVKGTDIVLRVGTNYQMTILYNYPISKWIDFKLEVSWAPDATGSAAVYYKYSTTNTFTYVGAYSGYTMLNDLQDNGYLKWGLYAPGLAYSNFTNDSNHAWIVYHDNFVVTPISCTLAYTAGSNGTISGPSPHTENYGTNGTGVTAVPYTGYRFVNWSDGSVANPRTDSVVTKSLMVTANFAANAAYAVLQWTTTSNSITDGAGTWNQIAPSTTAGSGAWYDGTNYGRTMNSGDSVTFGGGKEGASGTITIGTGGVTPGNITLFNANSGGGYSLGASTTGPAITMSGGVITNAGSAGPTINCPVNGSFTYGANKAVVFAGNGTQTPLNTVTIVAGSTLQIGNNGASGSLGAAVLTNNGTIQWRRNDQNNPINISNVVYGTGSGTIYGDGATYVICSNLYYAGSTTLKAYNSTSTKCLVQLGGSHLLPTNTALTITQNGLNQTNATILDLNGFDQTVGSLAGDPYATTTSEVITNSSATLATLTVGGPNTQTGYGGMIAGNLGLVLNGSGSTLTLSNVANTYTGPTTINAGTLALKSTGSISNSATITVAGGATLDVSSLNSTFMLGSSQTLSNSAAGAIINGTNNTASGTVSLLYNGVNSSLLITNGQMTLSSSTGFKVSNPNTSWWPGSYKIIAKATTGRAGVVAGTVPSSVTVVGGPAAGTPALAIVNGELWLKVGGTSSVGYTGSSFTYDGSRKSPTITFTGSNGAKTTNYVGVAPTSYGPSVNAPTNAGSYALTNTVLSDANCFGTTNSQAFTISPTNLIITAQPNTKVHDGTTSATNTPAITAGSLQASDGAIRKEVYENADVGTNKALIPSVTITNAAGANVTASYNVTAVTNYLGMIISACTPPGILGGIRATATNLCAGEAVILTLTNATGTAPLFYQWQTNNVAILGANSASYSNLSVTTSDAADYTCVVGNGCGSITSSIVPLTVFKITIAGWGSGGMQVDGIGPAGQPYVLVATTNLATAVWTPLATNRADTKGVFQFIDVQATNYSRRFYRVATP